MIGRSLTFDRISFTYAVCGISTTGEKFVEIILAKLKFISTRINHWYGTKRMERERQRDREKEEAKESDYKNWILNKLH